MHAARGAPRCEGPGVEHAPDAELPAAAVPWACCGGSSSGLPGVEGVEGVPSWARGTRRSWRERDTDRAALGIVRVRDGAPEPEIDPAHQHRGTGEHVAELEVGARRAVE